MALKRTIKHSATPARSSVTSPGLRHVDVLASQRMVPGSIYVGWLCKNKACGLVIAVAPVPAEGAAAAKDNDDRLSAIKCPHCGDEDLYRWSGRAEHQYTARGS